MLPYNIPPEAAAQPDSVRASAKQMVICFPLTFHVRQRPHQLRQDGVSC